MVLKQEEEDSVPDDALDHHQLPHKAAGFRDLVGDADMHTMENRVMELKAWIGSVISYSTTYLDIIGEKRPQPL
ncbi:hypothetical protein ACFX13_019098 [Malus domestica]